MDWRKYILRILLAAGLVLILFVSVLFGMLLPDVERGLILVEGSVPGSKGGCILVRDAVKRAAPEGLPLPLAYDWFHTFPDRDWSALLSGLTFLFLLFPALLTYLYPLHTADRPAGQSAPLLPLETSERIRMRHPFLLNFLSPSGR